MDALLVRLKMTLHGEDIIAVITVEQAEFSIVLLLAVLSVVIQQHKTKTTAFPAIHLVENIEIHIRRIPAAVEGGISVTVEMVPQQHWLFKYLSTVRRIAYECLESLLAAAALHVVL